MNNQYRSDEINLIAGALAKAQGSFKKLFPNQDSPSGRFANLEAIQEATRKPLSDNGIALYHYEELMAPEEHFMMIKTSLIHESGQFISSFARCPKGKNEREMGNIVEITKRRHASMLLGISPSCTDPVAFDDNGAEQEDRQMMNELRKPQSSDASAIVNRYDYISVDHYEELCFELDGYPDIHKSITDFYSIVSLKELPRSEYHKARAKISKIKKTQQEYQKRKIAGE